MGNIASTDSNLLVAGMDRNLRDWLSISIVLGVALITGGLFLLTIPSLYPHHREGILVATASGFASGSHTHIRSMSPLPTDDWPFLYLPNPAIPWAYTMVVVALVLASIRLVRVHELSPKRFTAYHGHLFFLGAAFLLMEVFAINRLALLFGTTWIVSAVTIMVVLMLIVAANLTLTLTGNLPYGFAYAGLFSSLLVSFAVDTHSFLGQGFVLSVAFGFIVLLPVFFAALVFARSFARAPAAGPAIGANMLGAVIGGWAEYSTMALGIRALALLALAFYLGSLVCLARARLYHTRN
jgi:hypothetical protein